MNDAGRLQNLHKPLLRDLDSISNLYQRWLTQATGKVLKFLRFLHLHNASRTLHPPIYRPMGARVSVSVGHSYGCKKLKLRQVAQ